MEAPERPYFPAQQGANRTAADWNPASIGPSEAQIRPNQALAGGRTSCEAGRRPGIGGWRRVTRVARARAFWSDLRSTSDDSGKGARGDLREAQELEMVMAL